MTVKYPLLRAAGSAAFLAAALAVFGPAIAGGPLWDDRPEVYGAVALRTGHGLAGIWTGRAGADYFPLKSTIEWVAWQMFGGSPSGFHLLSICAHALSACLLWRVLERLWQRRSFAAWLAGAIFLVHPIAVESVAWVAELKNTLSLPFLLGSALAFLDGAETVSLILFAAALLTKTSVVMFPVILFLHRPSRRVLPFFTLSLVFGGITYWFQTHRAIGDLTVPLGSLWERAVRAGHALAFYARQAVWPVRPMPIYPAFSTPDSPLWILAWLSPIAATVAWWRRLPRFTGPAMAIAFFAIMLLPVLGLAPMSYLRVAPVADHFEYISLVAVAAALGSLAEFALSGDPRRAQRPALEVAGAKDGARPAAGGSVHAPRRTPGRRRPGTPAERRPLRRHVAQSCLIPWVVWFALVSRREAHFYGDENVYWAHAVAQNPGSWLAQNNLGSALLHAGKPAEALPHLDEADHLKPGAAEILANLADARLQTHDIAGAISAGQDAVRAESSFATAHYNLANALIQAARPTEAIREYAAASRLEPDAVEIRFNWAHALADTGDLSGAREQFAAAVCLDPQRYEIRMNYGMVLAAAGQLPAAEAQFEAALSLRPNDADARQALAEARAEQRR